MAAKEIKCHCHIESAAENESQVRKLLNMNIFWFLSSIYDFKLNIFGL